MATEKITEQLKKQLEEALAFKEVELITRREWGSITFEKAEADLEQIFGILSQLRALPFEKLPEQVAKQIVSVLPPLVEMLSKFDKYDIEQQNHTQIRDSIITDASGRVEELLVTFGQWIPYLAYQKGDVAKNIEELSQAVTTANELYASAETELQAQKETVDKIVTAAREASASAGAAVFTEDFLREARKLEEKATPWLKATGWFGGGTVAAALLMWWLSESGLDSGQIVQKVGTKIFVLAVLFTATLWCGRMYKSLKHQAAVYRHRGLSIQTLEAFHHSAADPSAKDAVVLEAARAVYGSTPTGFVDSRSPGGDPATRIIEVTKSLVPIESE